MTEGCGRLPTVSEMQQQLRAAGFTAIDTRRLLPGENVLAFTASG
jgi:hypothetical protein